MEKNFQKAYPKVSIIILNWNGWKDTIECLESLHQITYPNYDIIIVDNGSKDDSVQKIRRNIQSKIEAELEEFRYEPGKEVKIIKHTEEKEASSCPSSARFVLIKNRINQGYAEGNNIGMRYALKILNPDYILSLNNDTVMSPNFLAELIEYMESNNKIGGIQPKIYEYNSKVIQGVGRKLNLFLVYSPAIGTGEIDQGQYDTPRIVKCLNGPCMLFRKRVLEEVGVFDPIFFANVEDVDICLRISQRGHRLVYLPTSVIWHKGGKSKGGIGSPIAIYLNARNWPILVRKQVNKFKYHLFLLHFIFIWTPLLFVQYILKGTGIGFIKNHVRGFMDHLMGDKLSVEEFR